MSHSLDFRRRGSSSLMPHHPLILPQIIVWLPVSSLSRKINEKVSEVKEIQFPTKYIGGNADNKHLYLREIRRAIIKNWEVTSSKKSQLSAVKADSIVPPTTNQSEHLLPFKKSYQSGSWSSSDEVDQMTVDFSLLLVSIRDVIQRKLAALFSMRSFSSYQFVFKEKTDWTGGSFR